VNRVIQKYVHPQQFAVLVVGNESDFEKPLSALGPTTKLDITIPGRVEAASAERPHQSNAEGKQLMAKVVEFLGGEAKLKSINALEQKSTIQQATPGGSAQMQSDEIVVFPDKLVSTVRTEGQLMKMVVTPEAAFQEVPGRGVVDIPPSGREEIMNELTLDFLDIARHASDPAYTFVGGEHAKVGETEAVTLDIYTGNLHERWFINPHNGELLRATYEGVSQEGPEQRVIDYSVWKQIDGITLPYKSVTTRNGESAENETTESWTVNPKVDPSIFQKPAAAASAQQ